VTAVRPVSPASVGSVVQVRPPSVLCATAPESGRLSTATHRLDGVHEIDDAGYPARAPAATCQLAPRSVLSSTTPIVPDASEKSLPTATHHPDVAQETELIWVDRGDLAVVQVRPPSTERTVTPPWDWLWPTAMHSVVDGQASEARYQTECGSVAVRQLTPRSIE